MTPIELLDWPACGGQQGHRVRDRWGNKRVLTLLAGSTTQVELPFTGIKYPHGVAVDNTSAFYVTDYDNNRVVKLAAGAMRARTGSLDLLPQAVSAHLDGEELW
jgi:DNA-binding beta-propeller fold protein YncE